MKKRRRREKKKEKEREKRREMRTFASIWVHLSLFDHVNAPPKRRWRGVDRLTALRADRNKAILRALFQA